jgi:hypothetical protein
MMSDGQSFDSAPQAQPDLCEKFRAVLKDARSIRIVGEAVDLLNASRHSDPEVSDAALAHLARFGKRLSDLVVHDPRFPGSTPFMICMGSGATGLYPNFMGNQLLCRLLRTGDAEGTIHWLQKVLGTNVAAGQAITAIWGVQIDSPIQLTDDVRIVPFDELPEGRERKIVYGFAVADRGQRCPDRTRLQASRICTSSLRKNSRNLSETCDGRNGFNV